MPTKKTNLSYFPLISLSLKPDRERGVQVVSAEGKRQGASMGQNSPTWRGLGQIPAQVSAQGSSPACPAHYPNQGVVCTHAQPRSWAETGERKKPRKSQGWFLRGWLKCHPHQSRNVAGRSGDHCNSVEFEYLEVTSSKWKMATRSFQQANTPQSHPALLYILWLSVKEVSKLPRCWSRTCIPPALLRSAGIVWDFLSAPVCLDNQASCTLQGEVKTAGLDEQLRPHHYRITWGTRMETWPRSNTLIWFIPDNPSGTGQATLVLPAPDGPRANETAVLLLRKQRCSCDLCLTCSRLRGTLPTCAGSQECLGLGVSCRSWRGGKGQGAKMKGLCLWHGAEQSSGPTGFLPAWVGLASVCTLPSCLGCGREHRDSPSTPAPDERIQYLAIFLLPTYLKWNKHTLERK